MPESTASRVLKPLRNSVLTIITFLLTISAAHAGQQSAGDLLAYMDANIQDGSTKSIPKYDRLKHFGAWVKQDPDNPCHDTRENVLARDEDNSVPIKFNSGNCTVKSGLWHDPYTGTDFQSASELQIDHVVPLRAAYYAGASDWPPAFRCHYANYLSNNFHLASVSGHENMSKGDRGPDGYLPPDHKNRCWYVSTWMKIKMIWELSTTQAEVDAIRKVIADEQCDSSFLAIDKTELARQRKSANAPINECLDFGS